MHFYFNVTRVYLSGCQFFSVRSTTLFFRYCFVQLCFPTTIYSAHLKV